MHLFYSRISGVDFSHCPGQRGFCTVLDNVEAFSAGFRTAWIRLSWGPKQQGFVFCTVKNSRESFNAWSWIPYSGESFSSSPRTAGKRFPQNSRQPGFVFPLVLVSGESFSEQVMVQDSGESFLHFQGQRGNQRPWCSLDRGKSKQSLSRQCLVELCIVPDLAEYSIVVKNNLQHSRVSTFPLFGKENLKNFSFCPEEWKLLIV